MILIKITNDLFLGNFNGLFTALIFHDPFLLTGSVDIVESFFSPSWDIVLIYMTPLSRFSPFSLDTLLTLLCRHFFLHPSLNCWWSSGFFPGQPFLLTGHILYWAILSTPTASVTHMLMTPKSLSQMYLLSFTPIAPTTNRTFPHGYFTSTSNSTWL